MQINNAMQVQSICLFFVHIIFSVQQFACINKMPTMEYFYFLHYSGVLCLVLNYQWDIFALWTAWRHQCCNCHTLFLKWQKIWCLSCKYTDIPPGLHSRVQQTFTKVTQGCHSFSVWMVITWISSVHFTELPLRNRKAATQHCRTEKEAIDWHRATQAEIHYTIYI